MNRKILAPNQILVYVPCIKCNAFPSNLKIVIDTEGKFGAAGSARIQCTQCGRHSLVDTWNSVNEVINSCR